MEYYVIEMVSRDTDTFIGPFICEEDGRPAVRYVSEANGAEMVGSVFTHDEVDEYRLDLEEGFAGLVLTCKMRLPIAGA